MWDTVYEAFTDLLLPDSSDITITKASIAIMLSLTSSIAVYILYQLFYGARNIGAGVNRCFIIAGPSITVLFLGIQSSIPLSLGLLGALSFVRFRTPVKDPAEIGFLLLLIATSIGAATETFAFTIFLFLAVSVTLIVHWFIQNNFSVGAPTNFMVSMDKDVFSNIEHKLNSFLEDQLEDLRLKSISVQEDRVSIHYQHRSMPAADKADFIAGLNKLVGTEKIEFFAG